MNYTELMNDENYVLHHTSWKRGYVSRKLTSDNYPCYAYSGRFGTGYVVEAPDRKSTRYCHIIYFLRREA